MALVACFLFMAVPAQAVDQPELGARVVKILEIDGLKFKDLNKNGKLDAYEDWRLPVDERVKNLVSLMTLEEKVGQMVHPWLQVSADGVLDLFAPETSRTAFDGALIKTLNANTTINKLHITHVLNNGQAPPATFAAWSNRVQEVAEATRLGIPVKFSSDPRHSVAGRSGVQYFSKWPDQIGLAATRDVKLVEEFGKVVAAEYRAVGLHEALHPQADLATEPRWRRIGGTFGEDAQLAAEMTYAYIHGLQGDTIGPNSVLAMAKHFPGGGAEDRGFDAHYESGQYQVYPGNKFNYHLIPWEAAFRAHAAAVMPYYSITTVLDNVFNAASKAVITDLLRNQMGFDGVVCTDWAATTGMPWGLKNLSIKERVKRVIEAGVDQFGGEDDRVINALIELVREGSIPESRIDESVSRILKQVFQLGLFENPYVDTAKAATVVGNPRHMALGYQAQLESIVLLTNDGTLPVSETRLDIKPSSIAARKTRIYVSGISSEVAGQYATVVDSPEEADVAVLFVAPGTGPANTATDIDITISNQTRDLILNVAKSGVPTIVAFKLSQPCVIPKEVVDATAGMLATFGVTDNALLDVVFGRFNPTGKLPFQMPATMDAVRKQLEDTPFDAKDVLFDYGHGLSYK